MQIPKACGRVHHESNGHVGGEPTNCMPKGGQLFATARNVRIAEQAQHYEITHRVVEFSGVWRIEKRELFDRMAGSKALDCQQVGGEFEPLNVRLFIIRFFL